jgi:hypothetical protein
MISRREAMDEINLAVSIPDTSLEPLMWSLYQDYAEELSLSEPFNPSERLIGGKTEFEVVSGYVESIQGADAFVFSGMVEKRDYPEVGQVNVSILKQGWKTIS